MDRPLRVVAAVVVRGWGVRKRWVHPPWDYNAEG